MIFTIIAFLTALSILIFVHEYGHYRAALWCGVKVERFAIGFGKPLLKWTLPGRSTEFVIGMLPLGGYVKMVDGRQGTVSTEDAPFAFSGKSLGARAFIVVAGPLANLLLAVLLYAGVNWAGLLDAQAVLASPVPGSTVSQLGFRAGDRVRSVQIDGAEARTVEGYSQWAWALTQALAQKDSVVVNLLGMDGVSKSIRMGLAALPLEGDAENPLAQLGFRGAFSPAQLGTLAPDGAALASGLKQGDLVKVVDGQAIEDAAQLRDLIRRSTQESASAQAWQVLRQGQVLTLPVQIRVSTVEGQKMGRIGAIVGSVPETVVLRYGLTEGLQSALVKTQETASLSVSTLAKMLVGRASFKQVSGPLSIAEYAGKTAERGWQSYILFLALISVSLGVLNLLPIPVLDGGHLMYYLWEAVTGKAVSDRWIDILQKGGGTVVLMLMLLGLFNDLSRIF